MRTLEIFPLEGQRWVMLSTHGDTEKVRAEPFAALELDMSHWWLEGPSSQ